MQERLAQQLAIANPASTAAFDLLSDSLYSPSAISRAAGVRVSDPQLDTLNPKSFAMCALSWSKSTPKNALEM